MLAGEMWQLSRGRTLRCHGKVKREAGAHARRAVHGDAATTLAHDRIDGGKAESRPHVWSLRRVKWLERTRTSGRVHSRACIAHDERDIPAGRNADDGRVIQREVSPLGLEREDTAVRHGIARVDGEIYQHLLDLAGVGDDGEWTFTAMDVDTHAW